MPSRRQTYAPTDTGAIDRTGAPQPGDAGDATAKFLAWANEQYAQNPGGFELPPGTKLEGGRIVEDNHLLRDILQQGLLAGAGAVGLHGIGAAVGSTGAGASGGVAGTSGAAGAATTGAKVGSSVLDWMKLLLPAGLSFAGGAMQGDPFQKREKFTGDVAPDVLLRKATQGADLAGQSAVGRLNNPVSLRNSTFHSQPGFTKDPAIADPSLLAGTSRNMDPTMFGGKKPVAPAPGGLESNPADPLANMPPDVALRLKKLMGKQ